MEITDMECCVPAISAKVFFNEIILSYRLAHRVLMCMWPKFRNEVYFGNMQLEVAVWMVEEFSERMLITPPEEC